MSTKIYFNEEDKLAYAEKIFKELSKKKIFSKTTITVDPDKNDDYATLNFTSSAFVKIMGLVMTYSTEVEWHCLAKRTAENKFTIYDVLTFPHKVTGTTVVSDQEKYEEWLNSIDDETFNNLRAHGHSHVNMGVTPSSVDKKYREDLISTIPNGDDAFYIFFIINKKLDISAEIYDIKNNKLYSDDEIMVESIDDNGEELFEFIDDALQKTKEEPSIIKSFDKSKKEESSKSKYNWFNQWESSDWM